MSRFILTLLSFTTVFAGAQETLMRIVHDTATDTHVEVLALFTNPAPAGYLPVRITIANNQSRSHRVELRSEVEDMLGRSGASSAAAFTVSADAGQVVTRDVLMPTKPGVTNTSFGASMVLTLTGSMGSDEHRYYQNHGHALPQVLMSGRLHMVNASQLSSAADSLGYGSGRGGSTELTSRFDPKQLPADWQAYGAYDWMIVTDEEWAGIPAGQRNAILAWVRLGGNLDIRHRMERFERGRLALPDDAGFGTITGSPVDADLVLDANQVVRGMVAASVLPPRGRSLAEDFDGRWPLQRGMAGKDFQFGMFIVVLVVFMVVVGPVNMFFLAPAGRRHLLFVTTPLISLGASLLMIALIIFQDGFGGKGGRLVLMEVRPDDGQHAAFIHQEQFSRTGILTRTAFEVEVPALLHPVPIAQNRWARFTNHYESGGTFNLQPRGGKLRASGDWFQSRSEQGQILTAVVPTRGRIERDGAGGFVSSFPHEIDVLYFRDTDGGWHVAENVATGQRTLTRPVDAGEAQQRLDAEAGDRFTSRLSQMFSRVRLRTDHFIAITNAAPGIDTHPGIRWEKTRTVITGPVVPVSRPDHSSTIDS